MKYVVEKSTSLIQYAGRSRATSGVIVRSTPVLLSRKGATDVVVLLRKSEPGILTWRMTETAMSPDEYVEARLRKTLADNIRALAYDMEVTHRDLAAHFWPSATQAARERRLQRILAGGVWPQPDFFMAACDFFQVEPSTLLAPQMVVPGVE